jgi:hypothetical protein
MPQCQETGRQGEGEGEEGKGREREGVGRGAAKAARRERALGSERGHVIGEKLEYIFCYPDSKRKQEKLVRTRRSRFGKKVAPSNLSHTTRDRTARIIWGDVDGASSLGVNAIYSIKNVTIYQVLDFPLDTCISNS